jgi:hypothetical protein
VLISEKKIFNMKDPLPFSKRSPVSRSCLIIAEDIEAAGRARSPRRLDEDADVLRRARMPVKATA